MNPSGLDCLAAYDTVDDLAGDSYSGDGNGIVLRDFLVANYSRLHQRLLRHLGCADLASDCLHDAWLRLGDMAIPASVQSSEAYVYRVACNLAVDHLRGQRSSQYVDGGILEYLVDPAASPDRIAELRSDLAAVERAMQRLPYRHHSILVALRIEEKTRQEVADGYRVSLTRVDTMLRQALDHCAEVTGQTVIGGISRPRRCVSRRWQAKLVSAETNALARQLNGARQRSEAWRQSERKALG